MVIPWLAMLKMFSMKASFNLSLQKTSYSLLLLLCAALLAGGTAFAQGEHDHGNAKTPVMPTDPMSGHSHGNDHTHSTAPTPIKEVALPEGLSSAQSIAIDSTGRIWFTEKVGKKQIGRAHV